MADSFGKKEREKKKKQKKKEKEEKKKQKKIDGVKSAEFMYVDEYGQLTETPPDPSRRVVVDVDDIEISIPKKSDLDKEDPIKKGVVKFYNEAKFFGFIQDTETGNDYFVHVNNLIDPIKEKDKVTFEVGSGPKGPIAINVKLYKGES